MHHAGSRWSRIAITALALATVAAAAGAQEDPVKKVAVHFRRGKSSAVFEDAVIRGERTIYLVRARAGQTMKASITSIENNAVFDVEDPKGKTIPGTQESRRWAGKLRLAGTYRIWVGGTRGNATYKFRISVR